MNGVTCITFVCKMAVAAIGAEISCHIGSFGPMQFLIASAAGYSLAEVVSLCWTLYWRHG